MSSKSSSANGERTSRGLRADIWVWPVTCLEFPPRVLLDPFEDLGCKRDALSAIDLGVCLSKGGTQTVQLIALIQELEGLAEHVVGIVVETGINLLPDQRFELGTERHTH